MLDPNTKFEVENEVEIFCQDLRMMTLQTDQLFAKPQGTWVYQSGANRAFYREPDGYREDGRPCSR